MRLSLSYIIIGLWLISTATASRVYPYIVFLNPSAPVPPKPINKSIQHRSAARNMTDVTNNHPKGYLTQAPEVYSIGSFRWYMDHMDDEDAEILNKRNEISHMHKDDPVFHISEQVQTHLPSWASCYIYIK
jgi:hypothetical protein